MHRRVKHIALVGLSGTGKSTVGPLLAAALGLSFVDTDREIELAAGMPIHEIFERQGEPWFRALEAEQVRRALEAAPSVISLGGGAVLDGGSRRLIWERAVVVWLQGEPRTLARRLRRSDDGEQRPLLAGKDPAARLAELLAQRSPYYSAAHIWVDTTDRTPEEVAAEVLDRLSDRHPAGRSEE